MFDSLDEEIVREESLNYLVNTADSRLLMNVENLTVSHVFPLTRHSNYLRRIVKSVENTI